MTGDFAFFINLLMCVSLMYMSFFSYRLKGVMEREKDEQSECEIIKDSPDSPEPLNKKPRLATEEQQPPEKSKGSLLCFFL